MSYGWCSSFQRDSFRLKQDQALGFWDLVQISDAIDQFSPIMENQLDARGNHQLFYHMHAIKEVLREEIKNARLVANPGCYPTSVQLPLVPFIKLSKELCMGHVFDGWKAGLINFPPTYKHEINSNRYVGERPKEEEKKRYPTCVEGMTSEKLAGPNLNSLCGFEVIDKIKYLVKEECPITVSCVDILAMAARDVVELRGGPRWDALLGRKDALESSFSGANILIPAPNSSLEVLIDNFKQQGLDIEYLVTLSGSHTIGRARCLSFRQRIYDAKEEYHYGYDHYKRYTSFRTILQSICPVEGRDNKFAPLDFQTPKRFHNHYFINILEGKGLLGSDNVLISHDLDGKTTEQWMVGLIVEFCLYVWLPQHGRYSSLLCNI
ncbi:Peroxidase 20 [Glycine soja]|uniref:Peroxidase n=1 Tax=Glycine soja TaxID=3848 RepID=A0A445F0A0_GLYSO|nr:Peroxidase 20 [Glycine soja]